MNKDQKETIEKALIAYVYLSCIFYNSNSKVKELNKEDPIESLVEYYILTVTYL